jgi:hypothetical protein
VTSAGRRRPLAPLRAVRSSPLAPWAMIVRSLWPAAEIGLAERYPAPVSSHAAVCGRSLCCGGEKSSGNVVEFPGESPRDVLTGGLQRSAGSSVGARSARAIGDDDHAAEGGVGAGVRGMACPLVGEQALGLPVGRPSRSTRLL